VEGAKGGTHLLCWGQDGLGVEGQGSSRDAAHDKEAVDVGGCAVVFRAVGGRWRGGEAVVVVVVVGTLGTKVMVMCTQLAEKLSCRRSKHITRKRSKTSVYWCANVFVLMPLQCGTMRTKIGAFDG
jgi:hypothetical protein